MDPGSEAAAFLENVMAVGGEVHNTSTPPDEAVNLPKHLRKDMMTLIVLVALCTFTFVLRKANIALQDSPLPEESHARLGGRLAVKSAMLGPGSSLGH